MCAIKSTQAWQTGLGILNLDRDSGLALQVAFQWRLGTVSHMEVGLGLGWPNAPTYTVLLVSMNHASHILFINNPWACLFGSILEINAESIKSCL